VTIPFRIESIINILKATQGGLIEGRIRDKP